MSYRMGNLIRTPQQIETVRQNGGMVYLARKGKAVSVEFVLNWPHKRVMRALREGELFTVRETDR